MAWWISVLSSRSSIADDESSNEMKTGMRHMEVDSLLTVQRAIYFIHNKCVLIEYVKRDSKSYQATRGVL